jgi:hypothetical protein
MERYDPKCNQILEEQRARASLENMVRREEILQIAISSDIPVDEIPYRIFTGAN